MFILNLGLIGTNFEGENPIVILQLPVMRRSYRLLVIILALFLVLNTNGQFYNGHQMSFGKNRVQHYDYYWSYYRFEDFDCYFNEFGRDLAQFTADYAMKKLDEIGRLF